MARGQTYAIILTFLVGCWVCLNFDSLNSLQSAPSSGQLPVAIPRPPAPKPPAVAPPAPVPGEGEGQNLRRGDEGRGQHRPGVIRGRRGWSTTCRKPLKIQFRDVIAEWQRALDRL